MSLCFLNFPFPKQYIRFGRFHQTFRVEWKRKKMINCILFLLKHLFFRFFCYRIKHYYLFFVSHLLGGYLLIYLTPPLNWMDSLPVTQPASQSVGLSTTVYYFHPSSITCAAIHSSVYSIISSHVELLSIRRNILFLFCRLNSVRLSPSSDHIKTTLSKAKPTVRLIEATAHWKHSTSKSINKWIQNHSILARCDVEPWGIKLLDAYM